MKRRLLSALVLVSGLVPLSAQQSAAPPSGAHDLSVAFRLGTLGLGLEVNKLLASHLGVRAGGNFFSYSVTHTQSDISYDANLKLHSFTALVDFYPGARGSFHLTAGLVTNPLTISATGKPAASDSFKINGKEYPADSIGTLTAEGKLKGGAPYVGLGFGTPATRGGALKFVFDLGAVIEKPRILLSASGTSCRPGTACAADLQAQQATTEHDVRKFLKVFPVLAFGLAYRF